MPLIVAFISNRNWINHGQVEITIDHVPRYERIANEARKLADKGTSVETISHATGAASCTIRDALSFSRTGVRPLANKHSRRRVRKKGPKGPKVQPKKVLLSAEVARLRDQQKLPLVEIARRLGASESTVTRAYDLAHQAKVQAAAEAVERLCFFSREEESF